MQITRKKKYCYMKKFLMTLVVASISILAMANLTSTSVSNNQKSNIQVEQLNDSTIIYQNVEIIEIKQHSNNLVLIYDESDHIVWAQVGSFKVTLPKGDYKVVSEKPFTKVESKTIVIYETLPW